MQAASSFSPTGLPDCSRPGIFLGTKSPQFPESGATVPPYLDLIFTSDSPFQAMNRNELTRLDLIYRY